MKLAFGIVVSFLILVFSLIPEIAMYFLWGVVNPSNEYVRAGLVTLFVIGGGGFCILFAFLGFVLWVTMMEALLK